MTNDQVKVCVVALIGKSQFRQDRNKAWKLNSLVQKNVFKVSIKVTVDKEKHTFITEINQKQSDHKLKEKFLKKVDEAAKNQPSGKIYYLLYYIHNLQILFDTYSCLEADQDVKSDQKEEDTNKTAKSKTYDVIFIRVEANIS